MVQFDAFWSVFLHNYDIYIFKKYYIFFMEKIMETITFAVKDVSNIFCWRNFREIVNSKHIVI